jgi:hypothetical protein
MPAEPPADPERMTWSARVLRLLPLARRSPPVRARDAR